MMLMMISMATTFNVQETQVEVTTFWGGTELGRCLQLTDSDHQFCQLTSADVRALLPVLQAFANGQPFPQTVTETV